RSCNRPAGRGFQPARRWHRRAARDQGLKPWRSSMLPIFRWSSRPREGLCEGEVLGIVGESGSGKTVACRSILRLLPGERASITSGKVLFEGRDLLQLVEPSMRE